MTDSDMCSTCRQTGELRPYGKNGAPICFNCAMLDKPTTERMFSAFLEAAGPVAVIDENGLRPATQADADAIQQAISGRKLS